MSRQLIYRRREGSVLDGDLNARAFTDPRVWSALTCLQALVRGKQVCKALPSLSRKFRLPSTACVVWAAST
jgi:hypothetical protein